jgi:uncharacterized protein (DUF1330 family)
MTKGYWIARVDVRDAEAYKEYVAANGAAFASSAGASSCAAAPTRRCWARPGPATW